ncbi:type VI secretion system secreted protein VgrG [Duganella sp. CF458]|uniref:type VI secretion system Vgr family protein n=1 Tax=Duganella sp. CF458 TaxID=1884368 RepID=UPI0008F08D2C|nr:type VI secretion system Vgr family protein [Duganella sp. CF458]SFF64152.1 type VI secretion system secreted protein VgrG [Duganella sp. CF458]
MDNALLSFFQQDKDLITDNRPLRLRLAHPTQMLEDVLLPQVVHGTEAICGSVEYRIMCVSLDAFIPLKELIALPVAIDIVTDRGDLRSICGIVTEARAGDSDGGLASYQLVLRDALSIMEKRTNTRVFRNKNEVEIVTLILDEWMQTNPIIGTCFHYEMDELFAHQVYPQREFTMQYNESDAAFIRRLLKRRGIAWYFRADQGNSPSHTMVLFNHPDSLLPSAAGLVRYHRDASTEERDTINSWCAVRTLQPASVTRFSWDYRNPRSTDFMLAVTQGNADQGESGNEMAASLDDYQVLSPHAGDDYDDLCRLGELAMNRHDLDSKCFHGEGSVRDMCVGEYFTLDGHPEIDGHADGDRDFVLTSMQRAVSSNLSQGLAERVQRVFSRNRWLTGDGLSYFDPNQASTRVRIALTAVRRGISIVPGYDPRVEVPNVPMQSAIVVGPAGEEVYCDELGRVKIRFRSTRPADHEHAQGAGAADNDADSAWVRVASAWAGNGPGSSNQCGSLYLPRVGSEVLVAFLAGDPDRPVVVGQAYNEIAQPPALSQAGDLPGNRYVSGIRSREIRGSQGNQLRFDDTTSEVGAQFASDHGSSQLNLGYLTMPRTDGGAGRRGEGVELRSDKSVAVRGEAGIIVTTERSSPTEGQQMDAERLTSLFEGIVKLAKELNVRATENAGDRQTVAQLEKALVDLRTFETRQPVPMVALAATMGIVHGSDAGFSVVAAKDIDLGTSTNISLSTGENTAIRAAQDINLFSNEGTLNAISAGGKVSIQAQADQMEVLAKKVVEIISTSEWITISAKKGVRINGGGSEIELTSGGIKGYTSGSHHMYAADHQTFSGKGKVLQFPGDKQVHKVCVPCLAIAAQSHSPFAPSK